MVPEERVGMLHGRHRLELNQKVQVAGFWIEIPAGRRAENVETLHTMFSAQILENLKLVLDYGCIAISTSAAKLLLLDLNLLEFLVRELFASRGQSTACPSKTLETSMALFRSQLSE